MKSKTGFYIFLFLCMAGLGVGAFFLNNPVGEPKTAVTEVSVVEIESKPESRVSEIQSEIAEEEEESQAPVSVKADFFVYPLSGEVVNRFSGDTLIFSKTYDDWRSHNGIDIKGSFGENVRACGDGKVIEKYYDELWGNIIRIDHGNGIEISYMGLDKIDVSPDMTVGANDTIGSLGELPCESLDGVHLHLEAKRDGEHINPLDLIS